jgi:hypothetical protein
VRFGRFRVLAGHERGYHELLLIVACCKMIDAAIGTPDGTNQCYENLPAESDKTCL